MMELGRTREEMLPAHPRGERDDVDLAGGRKYFSAMVPAATRPKVEAQLLLLETGGRDSV